MSWINIPSGGSPSWKDPVANAAALPASGNTTGDARVTIDTDTIYLWNGASWIAVATPGASTAIDGLNGDVSASGPGVVAATVNSVGGASASDIAAASSAVASGEFLKVDGSNSPSADISWASHKLTNLTNPSNPQDAATKAYVDSSATPNAITSLTSDVSASGPGSASATVNSVGGSSAANIHSAELAANAATDANTPSTIVKRDGSGNFTAGTITASLVGDASLDLPLDGTRSMSGALDMGTHLINNVVDPVSAQDAATKNYVDSHAQPIVNSHVIYVSEAGDDATGDGSINNPYLTISKAYSVITTATLLFPWQITYLSGGVYTDPASATLHIKPNVYLNGMGQGGLTIENPVVVDTVAADDGAIQLTGITFADTFTYDGSTSNTATLYLIQCFMGGNVTYITSPTLNNYFQSWDSGFVNVDSTGSYTYHFSAEIYGTFTVEDSPNPTEFYGCDFEPSSSLVINGSVPIILAGNSKIPSITASNTSSITSDAGSLPDSITGSPIIILQDNAPNLKYSPTTPADWNVAPVNVQQALDDVALASNLSSASKTGVLSSTDWSTFNSKQNALTFGNLTDVGTDGITVTSGTGAVIGSGTSLSQHVSDATHNGYLSSVDWSTFNGKQPAGSYITALTGDVSASGPGSSAATLATVNSNVGSFGSSTSIPSFTVNAKGLITAASGNAVIAPAGTLSGSTLNSTVTISSLQSLGAQSQALNMNTHLINNVVDPVSAQDAATKNYVDTHSSFPLLAPDGSASAPSYSFSNNSNMGMYRSGTNQLSFASAGTESLRLDGTADVILAGLTGSTGQLAFGAGGGSAPYEALKAGHTDQLLIHAPGASGKMFLWTGASGQTGILLDRVADQITFTTNALSRMTIDTFGSTTITPTGAITTPGLLVDTSGVSGLQGIKLLDTRSSSDSDFAALITTSRTGFTGWSAMRITQSGSGSRYNVGYLGVLNATMPDSGMDPYSGASFGSIGSYQYVTGNSATGAASGAANMGFNSKIVIGSHNFGSDPQDVAGAQSYGVRAFASGHASASNTIQRVGIFGWIAPNTSGSSSALEARDPGVSAAAVFSNTTSSNDILICQANTTTALRIDSTGNILSGSDGGINIGASAANRPDTAFIKSKLVLGEITTPSNPAANNHDLYFKSDSNLYMLNSSGTEVQVNAVAGSGFAYLSSNTSVYGGTNSTLSFTGADCTVVGVGAGNALTNGAHNTAYGYQAMLDTTTGSENVALGTFALKLNVSGASNIAIGYEALQASTGSNNTAIGFATLTTTTGGNSTGVGYAALASASSGSGNVALGYAAGYNITTASNSFYIGNIQQGSASDDNNYSLLHGIFAGSAASTSGQQLTVNGVLNINGNALASPIVISQPVISSTFITDVASTSSGAHNIALGAQAGHSITSGSENVAIGWSSLKQCASGASNVSIGYEALQLATGSNNTAIGFATLTSTTGSGNVGLGYAAGANITTDSNTFFVGNVVQGSAADDKAYSLLYGQFSGTAASLSGQQLTVNGTLNLNNVLSYTNSAGGVSTLTQDTSSSPTLTLNQVVGAGGSASTFAIKHNGTVVFQTNFNQSNGNNYVAFNQPLIAFNDNTTDIGNWNGGLSRPRDIYVGRNVLISGNLGVGTETSGDADATIGTNISYHGVTTLTASRTLTLPAASAMAQNGSIIIIKDESGAAGSFNIVINRAGSDTIDGATSVSITANYGVVRLMKRGAGQWFSL